MQSNANKEEKNIVEHWNWEDFRGDYNPGSKRYSRRLRRRRIKDKFKKEIKEYLK